MEKKNFQQQDYTLNLKIELNNSKLNYIFFCQSKFNNKDCKEILTWNLFDSFNQKHLYNFNFKEMKQVNIIDPFEILSIKVENFQKNSDNKFQNTEEDFLFFWKANKDPWNQIEGPLWAPYEEEN